MKRLISANLRINNVPIYAYQKDYPYWVIRICDNELWFYGAYDSDTDAEKAAAEIDNGLIIEKPNILEK